MEKRKYLYYHLKDIDKNKNNLIYNYIIDNKIDHNENKNGLLLNLSQLSEDHIDELYKLYNLKEKNIDYDFSQFQNVKSEKKVEKKKIYKKYELNKLEKMILAYS
jgi:Na+/phosphate symporter